MPKRKDLYVGKHLALRAEGDWEIAERPNSTGSVVILAFTDEDELILVDQERIAVGCRVIALPAGLVGDEDGKQEPREAARLELEEETGYRATRLEPLLKGPSSPGLTSEMMLFYRAERVSKMANPHLDAKEKITLHLVPMRGLHEWLRQRESEGILIDYKIYAALYVAGRMDAADKS